MPILLTNSLSRFDEFVDAVWTELTSGGLPLPEGVHEVPSPRAPLACAVDRPRRFAAFRWWTWDAHDESRLTGFAEAFCLPTKAAQGPGLRIGFQQQRLALPEAGSSGAQEAPAGPARLGTAPAAFFEHWLHARQMQWEEDGSALPGFIELSALLATKGQLSSSSHQLLQRLQDAQWDRDYHKQRADELESDLRQARARLKDEPAARWQQAFEQDTAAPTPAPALPTEWDELPAWCEAHQEQLTVLPRALNACKKSIYEKPKYLFAGLNFLATAYRDARLGRCSPAEMEQALAHAGVRLAGSVGASIAGEHGDTYFVTWGGRRRFLELHLLRGGGRDERYCLRIYFFWDDATQKCVVGWMPSHLDNSLS